MDKNNERYDAECDESFRNMQLLIGKLIADIEKMANGSSDEFYARINKSQYRLLKYKELLMHLPHIDESELFFARTELSKNEKQIAKFGIEALTVAIDELDVTLAR
ncbi:hypothetical protein [Vibrio renipiscarius]|uniref:Uncharacterized protein n=1 Tax=Vibrio renipiscarius TaxID=1461322 RepID=A0A0C2K7M3_9VIBR|nr:hypothetical protein [Vibrio renipiscarius]KII76450.1 hypothetical protein OJ16_16815 [Vibrio renipiscarius]KII78028.1 hypothetical protein PL18_13755 [Vibrio renipiscarius]